MTIKEYAESRGISYESVAKQVRKYKNKDLKGHLSYQGSKTILDEQAIEILDGHRQPRTIVMQPSSREITNELKFLQDENDHLKNQIIELQQMLLSSKDEYLKLSQANTAMIEDKARGDEQRKILENQLADTKMELEKYSKTIFGLYRKRD